jgi:tRNA A-37 threonylcarbamoyl transferase component Bud32
MRVRRTFDHFELQEPLGAGGMGTVYRALDTNLNRMVALKLLRREYSADPEFVQQFQAEAAITASINHPYVVKVYSTGEDHGLLYLAMELVDKGSLDDLMGLQGRVPEAQVLEVGIQIAKGLDAALQRGLIHRDIKPGNILFADAHTAKIVDFGLAVLMEHAGEAGAEVWGTPYYVAPEKLDNKAEDHRSDIYSLGASLFHALAGRPPFEAETASMVALKHVKSQAVSLQAFAPDVSSATAFVINKTLQKSPQDRYQNYGELIEHLEYARNQLLENAGGAGKKARVVLENEEQQRAMTWITFAIIALIVGGGIVTFIYRDRIFNRGPRPEPVVAQTNPAASPFDQRYHDARALVLAGKFDEGIAALEKLEAEKDSPPTIRNWLVVYRGMAELLAGRDPKARAVFKSLRKPLTESSDATEKKLHPFFDDLSRKIGSDAPIPLSDAKDYDKTNHESIALLLFALKDWIIGAFDESGPLFRQFISASPQAPKTWFGDADEIAALKKIAGDYVADYNTWRDAQELAKAAASPADRRAALEKAKAARAELKFKSGLADSLDKLVADLDKDKEPAPPSEEETRKMAEQEAADAQIIADAKAKANALSRQFKFSEARAAVAQAKPTGDKAKREIDALTKRMEWLTRFKATLINDLSTTTYAGPISRRTGSTLQGGVNRADETQVFNKTPYGAVPVAWPDLQPESVYAMAASFIRPGLPPEVAGERKWLLGVFTYFINRPKEARALLTEAAQQKREYADELKTFLEFAEPQA